MLRRCFTTLTGEYSIIPVVQYRAVHEENNTTITGIICTMAKRARACTRAKIQRGIFITQPFRDVTYARPASYDTPGDQTL